MIRGAGTNLLLASLSSTIRETLLAESETVDLSIGDIVWEPLERIKYAYFPLDSFVSELYPAVGQKNLELALVGGEGMLGIPLVLGVDAAVMQAIVQGSGTALRIDAQAFRQELEMLPDLRRRMNRYVYVIMAQLAVTATCNRCHALDARLARWLLMTDDRSPACGFHLTHKFLAQMLGVRRVGVTNAAGRLQKLKYVRYSRGEIVVLNRAGLKQESCSCYQALQDIYERVLA